MVSLTKINKIICIHEQKNQRCINIKEIMAFTYFAFAQQISYCYIEGRCLLLACFRICGYHSKLLIFYKKENHRQKQTFTKKGCKHVGLTMWFGYPVIVRRYTFVIRLWSLVDNVIWSDRSLDNVLVIYCDPIVRSCTKNCAYELFLRNIKSLQIIEIFPIIFKRGLGF